MLPSFVFVLFSEGKCEEMCILRGSLLEQGRDAENIQAEIKGDWPQATSTLQEVSGGESVFLHNKLSCGGRRARPSGQEESVRQGWLCLWG